jgi:hypothetical protein
MAVRRDGGAVLGRRTTYHGVEHPFLRGHAVVVVAVLKGALRAADAAYLTTEDAVARAGGVGPDDRVEVCPVLPGGRVSAVASDARAVDLACFAHLRVRPRGGTDPT